MFFKSCYKINIFLPIFHVRLRYIQKYTEKFGLKKYLNLNTAVTNVTYENEKFTVTVQTWKDNRVVSFLL